MGRPTGIKKVPGSGRKKGTPNKKTMDLIQRLTNWPMDPFDALMHIVNNDWKALGYENDKKLIYAPGGIPVETDRIELTDRLQAAKEVCQYVYPKRKALDLTAGGNSDMGQTLVDVVKMASAKKVSNET